LLIEHVILTPIIFSAKPLEPLAFGQASCIQNIFICKKIN
jgi:hypothetical protein